MFIRNKKSRGFTLVELMIVVAIIGILAALAVYGVRRYLTSAKTGEAKEQLGRLGKDAAGAYQRESMSGTATLAADAAASASHRLCASAEDPVPTDVPSNQKIQPNPAAWQAGDAVTGWKCLRFSINDPVYYQYGYTASVTDTGGNFTATAVSDLDGDGTAGDPWQYIGAVADGEVKLAPTIAEPSNADE